MYSVFSVELVILKSGATSSHRLEAVVKRTADGQPFLSSLDAELEFAVFVVERLLDGRDTNDDAAMHLPERLGVETDEQLLERRADHGLLARGDDQRVLVLRLEVQHVLDGEHADGVTGV